jgi:hypothetical protein
MAYGNTFDFRVFSFGDVETRYERTKPVREKDRGVANDIRPLGKRTNKHMRIAKLDADTYACVFYHTECVTYHRDGSVNVNVGGWQTSATAGFIDHCAPVGWRAWRTQQIIHMYHRQSNMAYIVSDTGFTIDKDGAVSGMDIPTKQKANRALTNEKRKAYKPFLEFARKVMEVLNIDVPKLAIRRHGSNLLHRIETATEEEYLELLSQLVYQNYRPINYTQLKSQVYRKTSVYDRVELPIGETQKR